MGDRIFEKAEHPDLSPEEIEFYESSFRKWGKPTISNPVLRAKIGTLVFVIAELMYFGGLISTFFVYRRSFPEWPPEGLPKYPVVQTLFNTLFLLASGLTCLLLRKRRKIVLGFSTFLFGLTFVVLQGVEWVRLVGFGLTMTTHVYGSIFYLIVGSHALHVVAGLLWLAFALSRSKVDGIFKHTPAFESATLFWMFVVLIWPLIYVSIYLS